MPAPASAAKAFWWNGKRLPAKNLVSPMKPAAGVPVVRRPPPASPWTKKVTRLLRAENLGPNMKVYIWALTPPTSWSSYPEPSAVKPNQLLMLPVIEPSPPGRKSKLSLVLAGFGPVLVLNQTYENPRNNSPAGVSGPRMEVDA